MNVEEIAGAEAGAGAAPVRGVCHAFFAYEIGFSVEMEEAARRIAEASERQIVRSRRRAPAWFAYEPAPLRVSQMGDPMEAAGFRVNEAATCTIYDFGAVSVAYAIPIDNPLADLPALSKALYDNPALLDDSRRRVLDLLDVLGESVTKPAIGRVVEDYLVFAITQWGDDFATLDLPRTHGSTLARILQAETTPLSQQQIDESLEARISFSAEDMAIADWNAAILFEMDPEDALSVFEHANVELAEMRHLDWKLDVAIERLYEALASTVKQRLYPLGPGSAHLRNMAELQADSALLFEGVNNAIKLIGDQYLARLYRLASAKFHLPEWDASVLRKIDTAESIYSKISDYQTTRRMEVLEIIIILLIAISIVLPFIPGFGGK